MRGHASVHGVCGLAFTHSTRFPQRPEAYGDPDIHINTNVAHVRAFEGEAALWSWRSASFAS